MPLSPQPRARTYASPSIYGRIIADVVRLRVYGAEKDLERLEREFAERQGTSHALCLAQGRLGLYFAISELVAPGREIILSPYTIFDVVNIVLAAGAVPIFADVDPVTGNLSPAAVRQALSDRTDAVLTTHIHGLSCEIVEIQSICEAAGVPLVEDCAQCLGAKVDNRPVGSFGDVGIFSFSRAKNVNTVFGGMLVTSNDQLHNRIQERIAGLEFEGLARLLKRIASTALLDLMTAPVIFQGLVFPLVRLDAKKGTGIVESAIGAESSIERRSSLPDHYLRRMTPLQARLGLMQLPSVELDRQRRVANARLYHEGLSDLEWLQLPPMDTNERHTYLSYPVQARARDLLMQHLLLNGRDVRAQYYHNLADTNAFEDYRRSCPNAQQVASQTILLPIYPDYPESEIKKNISAIRSFQRVDSKVFGPGI